MNFLKQHKIVLIFIAITLSFTYPIFFTFDNLGTCDWDQHFFYHESARITLLKYHQLPLWNPWYMGGIPSLANPQSRFLSPTFLFTLIFGAVKGLKIEIIFQFFFGLLSMYLLLRHNKIKKNISIIGATLFMGNGFFPMHIAEGHTVFMAISQLPLVLLFYERLKLKFKYSFYLGITLTIILFEGGYNILPPIAIILILFATKDIILKKQYFLLKNLSISLIVSLILGAIKIIPMVDLLNQYPRYTIEHDYVPLKKLYWMFLDAKQNSTLWSEMKYQIVPIRRWPEYGYYIGYFGAIFIGLSFIKKFIKQNIFLLSLAILFFLIGLGNFAIYSPWNIIHKLPIFNFLRNPSRFFIFSIFFFILSSSYNLNNLKIIQKHINIFAITIIINLSLVSGGLLFYSFPFKDFTKQLKRYNEFSQHIGFKYKDYLAYSSMYPALIQNLGTINGYEPLKIKIGATPYESKKYNGEVYFLNNKSNKPTIKKWTPNQIIINCKNLCNKQDTLIINQNYFHKWYCEQGKVINYQNKIGIKLQKNTKYIILKYKL